ncbi:MAG: 30S ribosomal protein S5 [Synechococcaceae bacterium WBA_2_066]|nr:30S ribosomal protein S5 [Synechococcaceae bacterium WB6_1A_059]NBP33192.1 30S ribosomal protein S5 [Synechococcaceae bacterium WB6_1B_055]NBQ19748.1 30S ribosomal protein S5 [Synechococcaceae bacterium WB5_2A_257]NBR44469.1 30S ribosomal protein S5 [Synechococcaceae bacterium WB5_2B_268]NBY60266.1 30S ribosomal protein S5 [Synechococcaceae bacterium LLD_019]NCU76674.1 30S ribosomal protein S5 [Synechococcaceae bacterium WB7_1C_051]NCU91892.1 30S ribosomal protein S5 [Synechococcaceae bact
MTESNDQIQAHDIPGAADVPAAADGQGDRRGGRQGGGGERRGRGERRGNRKDQERDSEWQERVVQIRRVSKTVKGGKKMSFRAIVVVGNEKGQVGVGVGKAGDVIGAVKKGVADGKKHLVKVPLTRHNSIPTMGTGCDGAASVLMRPAAPGTGVIAGGSIRTVLELAGVKNVLAKRLGSKTPLNNARATMVALRGLRTHQDTAKERGIPLEQIYS